ncbi:retrovirus-related pol polyprotein from transposon TNT 1-94, partial [Tanacetum coccineum]
CTDGSQESERAELTAERQRAESTSKGYDWHATGIVNKSPKFSTRVGCDGFNPFGNLSSYRCGRFMGRNGVETIDVASGPEVHLERCKIAYVGHRRFLKKPHKWRRSLEFNGQTDNTDPPKEFGRDVILAQLDRLPTRVKGKHPSHGGVKIKRNVHVELNWTKRSIFYELEYWSFLSLRHNLDIMHIEKNVLEAILNTLLMNDKSKDATKAARLAMLGIRSGCGSPTPINGKCLKPLATYFFLSPENRKKFCSTSSVKLPDGSRWSIFVRVELIYPPALFDLWFTWLSIYYEALEGVTYSHRVGCIHLKDTEDAKSYEMKRTEVQFNSLFRTRLQKEFPTGLRSQGMVNQTVDEAPPDIIEFLTEDDDIMDGRQKMSHGPTGGKVNEEGIFGLAGGEGKAEYSRQNPEPFTKGDRTRFDLRGRTMEFLPLGQEIFEASTAIANKPYNTIRLSFKAKHWKADPTTGTYDVEAIRRARPEEITSGGDEKDVLRVSHGGCVQMRWQEGCKLVGTCTVWVGYCHSRAHPGQCGFFDSRDRGGCGDDEESGDDEDDDGESCGESIQICLGVNLEPDEWIKDSGFSKHMMGNRKLFSSYKAYNGGNVIFGSNLRGNIIGKCTISNDSLKIDNVEHVDNLRFNLLSIEQICDNKCKLTFSEHDSEITKDGKIIGRGIRKKGLYVMKLGNKPQDKICLATIDENSTLWHRRLGHANMRLIQSLAYKELVRNLPKLKFDQYFCDACKV